MGEHYVPAAIDRWLAAKAAAYLSPLTLRFYRTQIRAFGAYCHDRRQPLAGLRMALVIDHMGRRRAEGRSPQSIRSEFAAIHAFLGWCIAQGLLDGSALEGLPWPKLPRLLIEPFRQSDVLALLAAAEGTTQPERDSAIILLMADTGIRASELCGIRDGDLQRERARIRIQGKGARQRWVPLSAAAMAAIDRWLAVRRAGAVRLFVSCHGWPLDRQSLYNLYRRLGRAAGIHEVRCSPHTMRHTMATEWIAAGGDLLTLQRLGGWSGIDMVRRYVGVTDAHVASAHHRHSLATQLLRTA